jgi:iron(III) transport system ATP-binding protein
VSALLGARGITTILVTHDQNEALSFADQVAVMQDGRLLQVGSPRDLYFTPRTPLIAEFLGDALILEATCAEGIARCGLGRISISDARLMGPARILLRPEQIVLDPSGLAGHCLCRVDEVEFGGSNSMVTLRVQSGSGGYDTPPFVLRRSGLDDLRMGSIVSLTVTGTAHAFP